MPGGLAPNFVHSLTASPISKAVSFIHFEALRYGASSHKHLQNDTFFEPLGSCIMVNSMKTVVSA